MSISQTDSKSEDKIKFNTDHYKNIRVLGVEDTKKAATTLFQSFREDALANLLVSHVEGQNEKDF